MQTIRAETEEAAPAPTTAMSALACKDTAAQTASLKGTAARLILVTTEVPVSLLSQVTGVSALLEQRDPSVKLTTGTSVCTTDARTTDNASIDLETTPVGVRNSTEAKIVIYSMYPQMVV